MASHAAPPGTVQFEKGFFADGRPRRFSHPIEALTAYDAQALEALLSRLDAHLAAGGWAAGYLSFEAGRCWEPTPVTIPSGQPLAWFGFYEAAPEFPEGPWQCEAPDFTAPVKVEWMGEPLPLPAWQAIRRALEDGLTYQVNLTGRVRVSTELPLERLHARLLRAQRAEYAAWLDTGERRILSHSPELFFRRDGNCLTTQPMKGTSPRGRTPAEDLSLRDRLVHDPKNRAENLMIVDLLRNDLGRICSPGTVRVPRSFTPQDYPTLWQLTSTITGELLSGLGLGDCFRALFPCGSVVGAPKLSTVALIRELEPAPRGAYCGALGWAHRQEACFNVAIRTLEERGGELTMGAGSGLVADSALEDERREWVQKTAFLVRDASPFTLYTTMRWDGSRLERRDAHLTRLATACAQFDYPVSQVALAVRLANLERMLPAGEPQRVRLVIEEGGGMREEVEPASPRRSGNRVRIADETVDSHDPFLYHKTSRRALYGRWRERADREGLVDYLFFNERGELTEGTVHNIVLELEGQRVTPALSCGLLPGTWRGGLLERGEASEAVLDRAALGRASRVWVGNALSPWHEVFLELP